MFKVEDVEESQSEEEALEDQKDLAISVAQVEDLNELIGQTKQLKE